MSHAVSNQAVSKHHANTDWLKAATKLLSLHRQENGRSSRLVLAKSNHDDQGDAWEAVFISPSAKQPGYWQVSFFCASGFAGDCQCPSLLIAVKRAMQEGFNTLKPDLLKEVALTPKFLVGCGATERRHTQV